MNTTTRVDIFKLASGLRCKVADLAIIVSSRWTENIGAIVEILAADTIDGDGFNWTVKNTGRRLWGTDVNGVERGDWKTIISPDSWLLPVTGLPFEDLVETDVEDHLHV